MIALYEGGSGAPADKNDAEAYADVLGKPRFPVFADGDGKIADVTPMDQQTHPQMCSLSPEYEILGCHEGHGAYEDAFDDIRAHAGL